MTTLIVVIAIAAIAVIFLAQGIVVVQQSQAVVIERLGSYQRTLEPGLNWIIPFFDKPRPIHTRRYRRYGDDKVSAVKLEKNIDRRETVLDFPGQDVVTRDNVTITINAALYFQIITPHLAVYEVENFVQAIEVLTKTSLRSVIGKMQLDEVFESREKVNANLLNTMDQVCDKWGVKINRVEIQDLAIPPEVENAMRLQMAAERERRATVTTAEGKREAQVTVAEGEKNAAILEAEGRKQSAILQAEGEQKAIEKVLSASNGNEKDFETIIGYLLGLEYLKTLPNMAKDGERVFVPYESSALIGALGTFQNLGSDVAGGAQAGKALATLGASGVTGGEQC